MVKNETQFYYKNYPILTHKSLEEIKRAISEKILEIQISLDLGLSTEMITINPENNSFIINSIDEVLFPTSFDEEEKICYFILDQQIFPLKLFNEYSNFYYKLVPTSWRPILRISATPMHKKPFLDAIERLQFRGFVLDSGTGLGYSAIIASKTATRVITIEWDESVLEIATYNPHSKDLFSKDNIQLLLGDVTEEILRFDDKYFDVLIQDGGMPKSSGNFFSQSHCNQLYRVLKPGGELIMYLPQHGKAKGRDYGGEHLERLKRAGFYIKKRDLEGSWALLYKGA